MDFSNDYEEWKNLLGIHVNTGEFLRKFRKHFKIIYYGHLSYMVENRHRDSPYEDILCLHVPQNKNFYLFFYGYEDDGNDSSGIVKIYNKKPTKDLIEKDIKSSNIFRYADLAKKYNWRKLFKLLKSSSLIKNIIVFTLMDLSLSTMRMTFIFQMKMITSIFIILKENTYCKKYGNSNPENILKTL